MLVFGGAAAAAGGDDEWQEPTFLAWTPGESEQAQKQAKLGGTVDPRIAAADRKKHDDKIKREKEYAADKEEAERRAKEGEFLLSASGICLSLMLQN